MNGTICTKIANNPWNHWVNKKLFSTVKKTIDEFLVQVCHKKGISRKKKIYATYCLDTKTLSLQSVIKGRKKSESTDVNFISSNRQTKLLTLKLTSNLRAAFSKASTSGFVIWFVCLRIWQSHHTLWLFPAFNIVYFNVYCQKINLKSHSKNLVFMERST